ncbi:chemotaxis protein CheA [Erwinia typographi]|uniref:Chemotaxis protein CheA n=1 Tax=Erwinia typographi TaxID=371042 RepID=A0A0A3Z6N1_9GAMM|nr:chemotaxis protein CheA [Erwinia typographi]KGT93326.1 chemotaxis protein CheA [Erwinia typographi]
MDVSDFYQTFFDEADELLADMENHLLALDINSPDNEMLNAIFRAAHSIKGGAGTFGFTLLQQTTHILENLLDEARCGDLKLTPELVNVFLETKDIMQEQLDAYKSSQEPARDSFDYICKALKQIAEESKGGSGEAAAAPTDGEPPAPQQQGLELLAITLTEVKKDQQGPLLEELGNLGEIVSQTQQEESLCVQLETTASAEDISAVLCFVLEPGQISFAETKADRAAPAAVVASDDAATEARKPADTAAAKARAPSKVQNAEASSIRVSIEKVDQIINQVGELIITQSMLSQLSSSLNDTLLNSIAQLERNARDLQESVMSIRMMPMEYVFSRFPRLVHDLANKLNKEVELKLLGGSAELDKGLIEKIIDPLTHLIRNSLDHGFESTEIRIAKGKSANGNLTISAEHHGGNIIIEVIDDGAGLNREKILDRARAQGLAISDSMSDEEVWMLIFAPGFSTAEKVTDVSGRGVGMDVVKRNIQQMGGHVEVHSVKDKGSTIRIILPLTLAILDGMSVRTGNEIFVLPLGTVMESLTLSEDALYHMTSNEMVLKVRDEYLPLIELRQLFNINDEKPQESGAGIAVILQSAGTRYALLVDQLIGQHQVVVKNLELNYRKVAGISAATILGDGSIALILDVQALPKILKEQRKAS